MSGHVYHPGLDGYDPRMILLDGCPECEARGKDPQEALAHIDNARFAKAWRRAYDWRATNGDGDAVGEVSRAETELLNLLWAIQVILERFGVPLGCIPRGEPDGLALSAKEQDAVRRILAEIERRGYDDVHDPVLGGLKARLDG